MDTLYSWTSYFDREFLILFMEKMAVGQQFVLFFVSIAFIVLGVLGSLLTILMTFLRHPLTAFKKKNRESLLLWQICVHVTASTSTISIRPVN